MRFMILVTANADSEAGARPSREALNAMTACNQGLMAAGALLAGEGPPPRLEGGARALRGRLAHRHRRPSAETKELLAGVLDPADPVARRGDRVDHAGALRARRTLAAAAVPVEVPGGRGRRRGLPRVLR